eukprot:3344741-Prymnesium_polylepis.1
MAGLSVRRRIARPDQWTVSRRQPRHLRRTERVSQAEEASPAASELLGTAATLCKDVSSMLSGVIGLTGAHHHVSVGWLLRATREDSVNVRSTSRGLRTP